jgi:hypothetical protein
MPVREGSGMSIQHFLGCLAVGVCMWVVIGILVLAALTAIS